MKDLDCVVIGSGAGGLAAALCLARADQKVAVIEQHDVPGGWCHSFYIDGHRFSPGVHYIGSLDRGASTSELYKGLGIAADLVFFRLNPQSYEHCYIGNERIDMPAQFERLYESLAALFPAEKKGLKAYLALVRNVSEEIYLIPKMKGFLDHLTIPYRTRHLGKYGLFSLERVCRWHIKDPLLRAVLNIQCGDHGLPPSKASFPFHCALMTHYADGGFYPMGGGAAIVKGLTKAIKKYGGIIRTSERVERILVEQERDSKAWRAVGVKLQSGEELRVKNIISDADPSTTYKLIGQEHLSKGLQKKLRMTRYSCTSLMFFLTVDMDLRAAGLDSGNIWLRPDSNPDSLYTGISPADLASSDGFTSLFISCSSLKDPTSYNGKEHTLEVISFIDYDAFAAALPAKGDDYAAGYKALKDRLCEKLITGLERVVPGIRNHIVRIEAGTPTTNEHYINATKGAVYGTEKGFFQTGPFAYTAKTEINNLYLCGASTISHGVAGASYSGVKAAAIILGCHEEELIQADGSADLRVYDADDTAGWPEWLHQKVANRRKVAGDQKAS